MEDNGFPICAIIGADIDVNVQGLTCVFNSEIADYNQKCSDRDFVVSDNPEMLDWSFPIHFVSGNSRTNLNDNDLVQFFRPDIKTVNIADCVDLHADGPKKAKVQDFDGGVFGTAGSYSKSLKTNFKIIKKIRYVKSLQKL